MLLPVWWHLLYLSCAQVGDWFLRCQSVCHPFRALTCLLPPRCCLCRIASWLPIGITVAYHVLALLGPLQLQTKQKTQFLSGTAHSSVTHREFYQLTKKSDECYPWNNRVEAEPHWSPLEPQAQETAGLSRYLCSWNKEFRTGTNPFCELC